MMILLCHGLVLQALAGVSCLLPPDIRCHSSFSCSTDHLWGGLYFSMSPAFVVHYCLVFVYNKSCVC